MVPRKTKQRIVGTVMVLLALSFFAAMVLPKHDEVKIMGELSKEEVSKISTASLDYAHTRVKYFMKASLKTHDIGLLARSARCYFFMKVISIQIGGPGTNFVSIGTGKDQIFHEVQYLNSPMA